MSEHAPQETVRVEWAKQDTDPDLTADLDYRLDDWEVVDARTAGGEQLMFLPNDEELIKEEAFIVADPDSVRDLGESV
ncbi:hypothetical protein [Halostella litorea]|uniref:hypothetical protein n=1 Tax=Halostella litorea TaxID=2528831 RepID=UPI00109201B6|nr:hypothetical protein [Halostella litorea]